MFVGKIFYIKNFNFAIPDLQKFGDCIDNIDNIDSLYDRKFSAKTLQETASCAMMSVLKIMGGIAV